MRVRMIVVPVLVAALAAAAAGMAGMGRAAARSQCGDGLMFAQARLIIEYNSTDEDIGAQVFLDGEAWRLLRVYAPNGRRILEIKGTRSLRTQGLTELFFESSEPPLTDVPLEVFLGRFPAGEYEFEGVTVSGEEISATANFTHAIPEPAVVISPLDGSVQDPENLVASWTAVPNPPGSTIVAYQVIVVNFDSPLPKKTFSVHVPANITSVTVPAEFMEFGTRYEFEVLAIEAGGNQTITTTEFDTIE